MQKLVARFRDWWERTPRAFTGTVLANRLGWQIARTLVQNAVRRFGWVPVAPDIREYRDTLKRDGIVLIPEFLPREIFVEIRKEFEVEAKNLELKPLASPYVAKGHDKLRVHVGHLIPEPHTRLYALLDKHFTKSDVLTRLGSTVVHEAVKTFRPPQIFVNKLEGEEYPDLNSDIYFHADVSYPGVKAFLYLSDTNKENGAFTYAKGTHKLSWKRWKWEYRKSIEHAKNRARVGNPHIQGDETGRSWHCLTRGEEQREGIVGTSMTGLANSVVMFNVMGFHRRGDFTSEKPREFAIAYYRT